MSQSTEIVLVAELAKFEVTLCSRSLAVALGINELHTPKVFSFPEIKQLIHTSAWTDNVPYIYRSIVEALVADWQRVAHELDWEPTQHAYCNLQVTRHD